jgi:hypothetical protein
MNDEQPKEGHVHADSMLLYAQDAAEHKQPWLLWQYRSLNEHNWGGCLENPRWIVGNLYRRKPAEIPTHVVNGFVVPAPVRVKPEEGARYLSPSASCNDWYSNLRWQDDSIDNRLLLRGQVFYDPDHAAANGMAQCGVDPKWVQP